LSITRVKASSITQGLPKGKTALTGNSVILPGSYESIATVTVGAGGTGTITFSSIPQTYKHLQIRGIAAGADASDETPLNIRINGVTTTSYSVHYLYGNGTTATAAANSPNKNVMSFFYIVGSTGLANAFGVFVIDILDYANTTTNKTLKGLVGNDRNGAGTIALNSGLAFASTAAVSSIRLYGNSNISQYSSFALYGIK